jgi:alpha-beta hydrolase superfamily lysophospholipase
VNKTLSGYNLWKVEHPTRGVLNKQPVLFIPGSGGRMNQAKTFSQSTYNDGTFQYFIANLGNEWSALHGSTVVRHATFVNDALEAIRQLYENENREVQIIVIAHSAGGIVARTSLLLSNQPKGCLVKAIVMVIQCSSPFSITSIHPRFPLPSAIGQLGTPNRHPAYSPDATMELLYQTVNNAWKQVLTKYYVLAIIHNVRSNITPKTNFLIPSHFSTNLVYVSHRSVGISLKEMLMAISTVLDAPREPP